MLHKDADGVNDRDQAERTRACSPRRARRQRHGAVQDDDLIAIASRPEHPIRPALVLVGGAPVGRQVRRRGSPRGRRLTAYDRVPSSGGRRAALASGRGRRHESAGGVGDGAARACWAQRRAPRSSPAPRPRCPAGSEPRSRRSSLPVRRRRSSTPNIDKLTPSSASWANCARRTARRGGSRRPEGPAAGPVAGRAGAGARRTRGQIMARARLAPTARGDRRCSSRDPADRAAGLIGGALLLFGSMRSTGRSRSRSCCARRSRP